jgi:hypothetical protein
MTYSLLFKVNNEPWNKGMIIGPKPPLKLKEVWAIRIRLQLSGDVRNLALFNLAIDSKLVTYPPAKPGALVVNRSKRSVKRSLTAP